MLAAALRALLPRVSRFAVVVRSRLSTWAPAIVCALTGREFALAAYARTFR